MSDDRGKKKPAGRRMAGNGGLRATRDATIPFAVGLAAVPP
jgi:hypothetical protein